LDETARPRRIGTGRSSTRPSSITNGDEAVIKSGSDPKFFNSLLVLLRHKVLYLARFLIGAAQHGHRGKCLTRARTSRRRMVAIEFGMCRSGRSGGASGSVTFENGRRLEHRGGEVLRGESSPFRRSGIRRSRCRVWRDGGSHAIPALRNARARPPAFSS
jgi:hypothetical protein